MNLSEEIKRMREIIGVDDNTDESTTCPKCDHSWDIEKSDPDPYLCHMCGYDQLSGEYEFDKLTRWEKQQGLLESDDESDDDYYSSDSRDDLKQLKKDLINLGVDEDTRLHLTHESEIKKMDTKQKPEGPKPRGLWYAVGFGWLDFTANEFTSFYEEKEVYAFEISLNGLNVLRITNYDELLKFEEAYLVSNENEYMKKFDINWVKVAENYDGIEIAPYIYKARMGHFWYYGWDVASGCIWNTSKLNYKYILHK
jgi:hypothetical protein